MPPKVRKPTAGLPADQWFVYMVRCSAGSIYTGITTDVARRLQQHNRGTASHYTRSRLPVQLIYQERHPSRSSALKREEAIKASDRQGKLAIVRLRSNASTTN
jgi:predicted GIY-YIG superfamily endonuclease